MDLDSDTSEKMLKEQVEKVYNDYQCGSLSKGDFIRQYGRNFTLRIGIKGKCRHCGGALHYETFKQVYQIYYSVVLDHYTRDWATADFGPFSPKLNLIRLSEQTRKAIIDAFYRYDKTKYRRLRRAVHLYTDLPKEKGGDLEYLRYAAQTIALSVLGALVYDVLKTGVAKIGNLIKEKSLQSAIRKEKRKRRNLIEEIARAEGVEFREEVLDRLIDEKLFEILDQLSETDQNSGDA
ncbi:MAG: hypothetical protein HC888_04560 [Candidatus Competibacteraceae bacterium]|nr:hypothetical protein [Candidatus Competibacteraceae bacterium]